jgi:penicillin-binding protein 1B
MMTNLLEEVMRSGTAAGVRRRGFALPAAGKTGTSHDGWFAGFTSKLLCVVWIGFDDNSELKLEGAKSALPVWTEFMKRAHQHREYRAVKAFEPPEGVITVEVDPASGALAAGGCPKAVSEVFVAGTQPVEVCHLHGWGHAPATQIAGWEAPEPKAEQPPVSSQAAAPKPFARAAPAAVAVAATPPSSAPSRKPPARKGWFRRMIDVFK